MNLKVSTWLVVALAGGALAAGCGSSSKSRSQTKPTVGVAVPSPLTPAQGLRAVATCKHGIQAQRNIPAGTKVKLEKICAKAASGSPTALRQAAQEACVELVNVSHVPAGAAKQRALALCDVDIGAGG
jgi:hypothetical protein